VRSPSRYGRQRVATEILRRGIAEDSIRVPHQAIMEFVAVVTRPLGTATPLLAVHDALQDAEEMPTPSCCRLPPIA